MSTCDMALHTPTPPSIFVGGRSGDNFRFTILADGLVRYEWAPDGVFEDRPSAFAANRPRCQSDATPSHRLAESADRIDVRTARLHLTYRKSAAGFTPETLSARLHGAPGSTWRYGDAPTTLGGTTRTLDGVDGRAPLDPGVASRTGFADLPDASMLFTADGFVAPRRPGAGRVDAYLFAYGHDYPAAVRALYRVSGAPPLLPRWALGNWWSRYYEYSAGSYLALMDRFADARVPLAVAVVDMDWHWVRDPRVVEAGASGWTGYSWNTNLFPDPRKFVAELHRRGLKVTLNEHPADGIARYEDVYEEMAAALGHDTSHGDAIPFDITDRAFAEAYYSIALRHVEDDGVDFWWTDWQQGTHSGMPGVDPLWPLNHFHFLHGAARSRLTGSRPLAFSRYAGPGSHRYPIGFSGDTVVSWASLAFQPEFTATASNVGYGWWSHDVGGHMRGARDDHLTARWVQLGVLSPVTRLHSTKTRWVAKEPWNLPAGGPREAVVKFLRLRHRLLPYLHAMNRRAAEAGEPLVRPLYWEHPARAEAYAAPGEYLFGTQLLAAPVTTPQSPVVGTGRVRAWLPPGTWVDFFTGVVYDGDRELWLSRALDATPLLMRQGAVVPLDADESGGGNGAANPQALEVVVAVGADGRFDIDEEDEEDEGGAADAEPRWVTTEVVLDQRRGVVRIGPNRGGALACARTWRVRLLGVRDGAGITASVGGVPAACVVTAVDNGTVVDIGRIAPGDTAVLFLGPNPQLSVNDFEALIRPVLYNAQVSFELKDRIQGIIAPKDVPVSIRVGQLAALDMDEDLRHVLNEFLLADSRS